MNRKLLLIVFIFACSATSAQSLKIYGKVTNSKLEPLAFANVQVKEYKQGAITKEDGSYELVLEEGKYEIVVSMIGYKAQVFTIILRKTDYLQDIIMEESDAINLTEVTVKGKFNDRAEEYIRNVIRNKDAIEAAAGAYSCNVYIKAFQEDSMAFKKNKKSAANDSLIKINQANQELSRMTLAEIVLRLDHESSRHIKEVRTGVTKKGNAERLFYLSTTDGDFNFYNNLVSIPAISQTPFLSPLSYSGLLAYRFKTIKTEKINGRKVYTISIKPRQLSNATVEGEITIADGSWVVLHTKLRLPKYHLAEYDFFEVEQQYELINEKAWMITRQQLTYNAMSDKRKSSGHTVVTYKDFELNKQFDKKYFGAEVSSAARHAYEQDSSFWQANRPEPLSEKEVRFIHYKDSVFQATHAKIYLDSVDKVINKVTWKKILYQGQNFNDHEKQRTWSIPPLPSMFQPFYFGGARIQSSVYYTKIFKSKKNINVYGEASYGLRNKDVNGNLRLNQMYNPFNRGFYSVELEKNFEYIYKGDAWINMINRNNFYLRQALGFGHGVEIANGLFLYSNVDIAFRQSLSNYETNDKIDSLLGDVLKDNQAIEFPSYNAFYGSLRAEYTPRQRYIREPKEKIILGSAWPTFYVQWKRGFPNLLKSTIDFDYLEFGIKQSIKLGVMGVSSYTLRTGRFLDQKNLQLVDYKYQRRGDPFIFLNPSEAFQLLDSTFPVFQRFYEGHYIHEFNGAFLNKVPIFKKLGLREIAGTGFLIAPERNLRYAEAFTGIERVFKFPFNQLGKFKVGAYVVGSVANQFHNPVRFKVGFTTWDKKKGKWL